MSPLQKKLLKALGILILALGIPLTLIAVKQSQEIRKRAIEANAAHLSLVPDSATLAVNETITSAVWLDSGSNGTVVVTLMINFDNTHLAVESIDTTDVFGNKISQIPIQNANNTGKIEIIQGLDPKWQRDPVVGTHQIAQIGFRAIATTGSLSADNVSFDTSVTKVAYSQDPPGFMTTTTDGARYHVEGGPTATPYFPTPTPTPSPSPSPTLPPPTSTPTPISTPLPRPICQPSSIKPPTGPALLTVTLHGGGYAGATPGIDGYQWDFENDGIWDTGISISPITHVYTQTGTYYPKYRVHSVNEQWSDVCDYPFPIIVTPPPEECWQSGDFNCDGEVDLLDFELFRDIYVEHL